MRRLSSPGVGSGPPTTTSRCARGEGSSAVPSSARVDCPSHAQHLRDRLRRGHEVFELVSRLLTNCRGFTWSYCRRGPRKPPLRMVRGARDRGSLITPGRRSALQSARGARFRNRCRRWPGSGHTADVTSERRSAGSSDDSDDPPASIAGSFPVVATRYDLRKLRLAQLIVPLAMMGSVLARRTMSPIAIAMAVVLMVVGAYTLLKLKTTRRRNLSVRRGTLRLDDESIHPNQLSLWRWQGDRARLYLHTGAMVLRAPDAPAALQAQLRSVFGAPVEFARRGSPRARWLAVAVFLTGAALTAIGLTVGSHIASAGVLMVIGGFAAFGTLSQWVPTRSRPN